MKKPAEILKEYGSYISYDSLCDLIQQAQTEALLEASEAVQEPYLKSGMTNLAVRAKEAVLNLIKQ